MPVRLLAPICFFVLSLGVKALPDTRVSIRDRCKGPACLSGLTLAYPKTTPAVTPGDAGPRFGFNMSGALAKRSPTPTFQAEGSLGLPNHPLGIFRFRANGSACGTQHFYLEDGVLAVFRVDFPPCPWESGDVAIGGRVDVWTTLPAVPVIGPFGIPTGLTVHLEVAPTSAAPHKPHHLDLTIGLAQSAGKGADRAQDKCTLDMNNMPAYPPPVPVDGAGSAPIQFEVLDLDMDPKTRWDHIVRPRAKYIKAMIDAFMATLPRGVNSTLLRVVLDLGVEGLLKRIPAPFDDEIRGISQSTGIDIAWIFIYNVMYELEGLCTSMVSEDDRGHVYHTRNLDFGLFDGTDAKTHNWVLTEKLRPLLVNVNFMRGGVSLYNTTQYAGFTGLLTGAKRQGFSISVNTRYDAHLDVYLVLWLLGRYHGEFLSWKTRQVMETIGTYSDALHELTHYKPIGPAYVILGGVKSGEGAVIELAAGRSSALLVRTLSDALRQNKSYIVQTNWDWPQAPPAFDDRRYPTEDCMDKLGSARTSFKTLWAVHSSTPTKNALTTYTALVSVERGRFEAYTQFCSPGPNCVPFMGAELYRASSIHTPDRFIVI